MALTMRPTGLGFGAGRIYERNGFQVLALC